MDKRIINMDIFSGEIYGGERNITCPVCNFDYTHIREVYTLLGSDEHEAGIYPGTQVKGRTSSRRSALAIVFDCEAGHTFELRIQQHKGINLIEVEAKEEDSALNIEDPKFMSMEDAVKEFERWLLSGRENKINDDS